MWCQQQFPVLCRNFLFPDSGYARLSFRHRPLVLRHLKARGDWQTPPWRWKRHWENKRNIWSLFLHVGVSLQDVNTVYICSFVCFLLLFPGNASNSPFIARPDREKKCLAGSRKPEVNKGTDEKDDPLVLYCILFYEKLCATDMKITDSVLRSFRVARTYRENSQKVNCVDYSPNGENAISSSDDDCIVLYDIREGK